MFFVAIVVASQTDSLFPHLRRSCSLNAYLPVAMPGPPMREPPSAFWTESSMGGFQHVTFFEHTIPMKHTVG
jgi:hypothetical protein